MIPFDNLNNSTKFASSTAVNVFFVSVNWILNLWAPGAFKFDVPVALSFKVVSSFGVVNDSVTNKPTL